MYMCTGNGNGKDFMKRALEQVHILVLRLIQIWIVSPKMSEDAFLIIWTWIIFLFFIIP